MSKKKEPTRNPVKVEPAKVASKTEVVKAPPAAPAKPVEAAKPAPAPTPAKPAEAAKPAPVPTPVKPVEAATAPAPTPAKPAEAAKPAPVPAKGAAKPAPAKGKAAKASSKVPASEKRAGSVVTVVVAKYDVGYGNNLYIRGDSAGLNWEAGVLMKNVENDVWVWTTNEAIEGTVEFKFLINDEGWCVGENMSAPAGETTTLSPAF